MVGLCRLCASLKKPELLINVHKEESSHDVVEKIYTCCHVKILKQDVMPKTICLACLDQLNASYEFYTRVSEAQETLKEFIPVNEVSIIKKEGAGTSTPPKDAKKRRSGPNSSSASTEVSASGSKKCSPKTENVDVKVQRNQKLNEEIATLTKENSSKRLKNAFTAAEELKNLNKLKTEVKKEANTDKDHYSVTIVNAADETDETCDGGGVDDEGYLQEVYNILGLSAEDDEDESLLKEHDDDGGSALDTFCNKENKFNITTPHDGGSEFFELEEEEHHFLEHEFDMEPEESIEEELLETEQCDPVKETTQEYFEVEAIDIDDNLLMYNESTNESNACRNNNEETEDKKEAFDTLNSWKDYNYLCFICKYKTYSFSDLTQHAASVHSIININQLRYECYDCHDSLNSYSDFLNHVRLKHHFALMLRCDACDKLLKDYKLYELHRDFKCTEKVDYPLIFTCAFCAKAFRSHTSRQIHVKHHLDGKKFDCKACPSNFPSKIALKVHETEHKQKKGIFRCSQCPKMYVSEFGLEVHEKKHRDGTLFQCTFCKKSFKAQPYLDKHITLHTQGKKFQCTFCPREFRTKIEQTTHERVHTGEMPLQCNQCEKRFRFRSALSSHLKTHSGIRMYACKYCERRFNDLSNYKKHLRRKHGEFPEDIQQQTG